MIKVFLVSGKRFKQGTIHIHVHTYLYCWKIVEFVIEPVVFLKKQQARKAAFVRKFSS